MIRIIRPFRHLSDRTNDVVMSVILAVLLTALSYGVGLLAGWIHDVNWLEAFAVATSYGSTWLCVVQRRFNYVYGFVSTAAYAVLFWQTGLLASTVLNAYLTPWLIYGWIRWGKDAVTRPVTWLVQDRRRGLWIPIYLGAAAFGYFGAVLVVTLLGGNLAWLDSAILALTILAQTLLDNKRLESWAVWLLVNTIAIYEYFASGLMVVGIQYILFWLNALLTFYVWKKSMSARAVD